MTTWILAVLTLFFVQTLLHPGIRTLTQDEVDLSDAVRARDDPPPMPVMGARMQRALTNMTEALFVFLPVALLLQMQGTNLGLAHTGAAVFFWARLAYVPAYGSNLPGIRSLTWMVGHVGLGMMIWALVGGLS